MDIWENASRVGSGPSGCIEAQKKIDDPNPNV